MIGHNDGPKHETNSNSMQIISYIEKTAVSLTCLVVS